ncbi:hypothetical protein [Thiolapillus sp.]
MSTTTSFYLHTNQDTCILDNAPPWGGETLVLDFCGGPYRFSGLSRSQAQAAGQRYRHYLLPVDAESRVATHVRRLPDGCFRPIDTRGWTYERMEYQYHPNRVQVAGLKMLARISPASPTEGYLGTSLDAHEWFPGLVFENYFRMLTAYRLLALGGVMLHSAGILFRGKTRLFLGHSGAGKSTLSELAHQRDLGILSDDLNVLLPAAGQVRVEKVPFTGTFAQSAEQRRSFDLGGLFRLSKGHENAIGPLGPGEALTLLLSCSPFVNEDPYRFERLADNLTNILQHTTTRHLVFNRDGGCFDLL